MTEAAFTKMLSSVLLDNKYDRLVKGKKSGKLDTKSLHKVNLTPKLFKKKEERKNKDYVVSLVVDCSSSMGGSRIQTASIAAENLSKSLSLMGINHNIVFFSNNSYEFKPFNSSRVKNMMQEVNKYTNSYSVYLTLDTYENGVTYKDKYSKEYANGVRLKYLGNSYIDKLELSEEGFSKPYGVSKNVIKYEQEGGTSYGQAVRFAIEKIKNQKGKKIIIGLSDGDSEIDSNDSKEQKDSKGLPMGNFADIGKQVKLGLKMGIEMYSIGIECDASNRYYPPKRTCAVYDLNQLYDHIIKMIKINLKRG